MFRPHAACASFSPDLRFDTSKMNIFLDSLPTWWIDTRCVVRTLVFAADELVRPLSTRLGGQPADGISANGVACPLRTRASNDAQTRAADRSFRPSGTSACPWNRPLHSCAIRPSRHSR